MCTVYDVHNHHHYTHTWIHLDQSWDSKKLKRMKLKRKSLLFAGLLTSLQSTIIVDKCSPFEITLYKKAWELMEEWEQKSPQVSEIQQKNETFVRMYVHNLNGLNKEWKIGMNTVVLLGMNSSLNELLLHCTIETDKTDFHVNKRRIKHCEQFGTLNITFYYKFAFAVLQIDMHTLLLL